MKEFLAAFDPPYPTILPKGAVMRLAEKYKRPRQTITLWLSGEYGEDKEEEVQRILEDAHAMLLAEIAKMSKVTRKVKKILPRALKSA